MTDIESLKFQLEAEKHTYTRNAEELIRQRDEALRQASDWETRARRAEALVEELDSARALLADKARNSERNEKYAHARETERNRFASLLIDAEAEVERLKKQIEADWNACCDVLVWSRRFSDDLPPPQRAVAALCARVRELDPTLSGPKPEPVSPAYNFSANPEWIPSAHAEKVLVAVAKAAAQLGAEEMRARVLKMLRTSAQAYGSASTLLRDYARDATNAYVGRIEGMLP